MAILTGDQAADVMRSALLEANRPDLAAMVTVSNTGTDLPVTHGPYTAVTTIEDSLLLNRARAMAYLAMGEPEWDLACPECYWRNVTGLSPAGDDNGPICSVLPADYMQVPIRCRAKG